MVVDDEFCDLAEVVIMCMVIYVVFLAISLLRQNRVYMYRVSVQSSLFFPNQNKLHLMP